MDLGAVSLKKPVACLSEPELLTKLLFGKRACTFITDGKQNQ